MIRCPNGHESAAPDYCDTCGIRIGMDPSGSASAAGSGGSTPPSSPSSPASSPASSLSGSAPPGGVAAEVSPGDCTNCGVARSGSERFCEICGLDFDTGAMPAAPVVSPAPATGALTPSSPVVPAPPPPGIGWVAVISCDRQWWEHNSGAGGVADGVPYPDPEPQPRRVELRAAQSVIGRTSGSVVADVDCGTLDTGVSRRHARVTLDHAGQWTIRDLGSTNGTYLGDAGERVEPDIDTAFDPSSTIKLGAFTVLRLEPVVPSGS
ncbi:MAG: FHA domain-containing protein [Acidimicrobiales bacterium]